MGVNVVKLSVICRLYRRLRPSAAAHSIAIIVNDRFRQKKRSRRTETIRQRADLGESEWDYTHLSLLSRSPVLIDTPFLPCHMIIIATLKNASLHFASSLVDQSCEIVCEMGRRTLLLYALCMIDRKVGILRGVKSWAATPQKCVKMDDRSHQNDRARERRGGRHESREGS